MIILSVVLVVLIAALIFDRYGGGIRAALRMPPSDVRLVCDLDAILTETVGFKFDGVIYEIPPISLEKFILAVQGLAVLDSLKQKKELNGTELLDAYESLFRLVCPKLTRKIIQDMGHQRIGALLNLIIEVIMGKATLTLEKKNPLEPIAVNVRQPAQA